MKKEIENLTQKDIDLHNETSKILGEPDSPDIDLRVGDSAGFEHSYQNVGGIGVTTYGPTNLKDAKSIEILTGQDVPSTLEPDGYRIAELVKILDKTGWFNKHGVLVKNTIANKLYEPLEAYFGRGFDEFERNGLQIKINKLEQNLAEQKVLVTTKDLIINSHIDKIIKLKESRKLLQESLIRNRKLLKKAMSIIGIKNKTIIGLATKLVSKG